MPLRRNKLNNDIQPVVRLVFEDIADQEELDVLNACYIHTGTLETAANDLKQVITETIPSFLTDDGAISIGSDANRKGFVRTIKDSVNVSRGELFLLLGAIGSGKSTFLKRFRRDTGRRQLTEKSIWFSVDFLYPPEKDGMRHFSWNAMLVELRTRYADLQPESRSMLKKVFADRIDSLKSTKLTGVGASSQKYQDILSEHFDLWREDLEDYVPRLVRTLCIETGKKPVVFLDNVDQLSPEYQSDIFLFAQFLTDRFSSVTIVALREESYYSEKVKKTFTAYNSRKFHIAPPHFKKMIVNRIEYAMLRLESERDFAGLTTAEKFKRDQIRGFLDIVKGGILENKRIGSFMQTVSYGNMRFALEMFSSFVTSGVTDVDKMLNIYSRDGWYTVAFHEFVKSVTLADRAYYREEPSSVCNIFNATSKPNSSHFTAFRVLEMLIDQRSNDTAEGRGFVEIGHIAIAFETVFDNVEDVFEVMNRLVSRHLIEVNTRSTASIDGASHVRATSAGWYYIRYLASTFAYLDLVLQDTPFDDRDLEKRLRNSVFTVNNLIDNDSKKVERVNVRFERVNEFLRYLLDEENREHETFSLDKIKTAFSSNIVPGLISKFNGERAWISRRISANREHFREDYTYATYSDEDADFAEDD